MAMRHCTFKLACLLDVARPTKRIHWTLQADGRILQPAPILPSGSQHRKLRLWNRIADCLFGTGDVYSWVERDSC